MATLHMDVDAATTVKGSMVNAKDTLAQQVTSLQTMIDGMVGTTWVAPGANQFQSDFAAWRDAMNQQLENLNTLSQRLSAEIAEWEAAAAKA